MYKRQTAASALANVAKAAPGDKELLTQKATANKLVSSAKAAIAVAVKAVAAAKVATSSENAKLVAATAKQMETKTAIKAYPRKIAAALKVVAASTAVVKNATATHALIAKQKAEADKRLNDIRNQTKPKNINVYEPSTPIVLHIAAAPIKLIATPENGGNVKRGQQLVINVKLERRSYKGSMELGLVALSIPKGTAAAAVTIPADATTGKLTVATKADTAPGVIAHAVVRARFKHEGREYKVDAPTKIQVQK